MIVQYTRYAMLPVRSLLSRPCATRRCSTRAGSAGYRASRVRAAGSLVLSTVLLSACSFEYTDDGASPEALLEHLPDTEFTDVTHTVVRDGRVVAEIRAQQVRNFGRQGRSVLEEVSYAEYDGAGNQVTTGSADRAVYYLERADAELAGAIRLRSESQDVRLEAEVLHWEDERRRLSSDPDEMTEIWRDDGTWISGAGLEVDVRSKTIRFSGIVSGTVIIESTANE